MDGTIPDWSTLPHLPLAMIAERLRTRIDTLRFRAVCNSFRSAVPPPPKSFSPYSDFECYYNTGTSLLHFVVTESTVYAIQPLSEVSNATQTWLIKVEESERGNVQLQVPSPSFYGFSALTNISEKLPPSLNLLDYRVKEITKGYNLKPTSSFTEFAVKKVVISTDEFVLMALIANPQQLVAWRSGSKEGSKIDMGCFGDYCIIADIIYHNKKFYVLNSNGDFIMVDPKSLKVTLAAAKLLEPIIEFLDMVKSSNDLLLTIFDPYCRGYFNIFKLDEEKHEWIKMKDGLEDKALFLGVGNCNFSVSDKELTGCKWNSVLKLYFGTTMIYDLGNNTCVYYPGYNEIFWPPPTWIFPQYSRNFNDLGIISVAACYFQTMSSHNVDMEDKAEWTPTTEGILIRIMHEYVKKGDMQTSTFSKKIWGVIADELYTEVGTQFTISQLKSKFNRLRKKHREFSNLIKHTEFGWDPVSYTVTAHDDVWKEYIQGHPGARAYRKKGLDHYDILCEIFNNSTANGELHFSSTQFLPKSEEEHDMDENLMEVGGDTTPVDDDEIFDMMMRTPVRGANRGKRPRRASCSVDPPPKKRQTSSDRFWQVATSVFSDHYARPSACSAKNASGKYTSEDKWSTNAIVEAALCLDGMEDEFLFKLCDKAAESLEWRKAFASLPDDKKIAYLRQL